MALSSAATDLSRPTNRGTIICGKTTMSRRGRTGKASVILTPLGPGRPTRFDTYMGPRVNASMRAHPQAVLLELWIDEGLATRPRGCACGSSRHVSSSPVSGGVAGLFLLGIDADRLLAALDHILVDHHFVDSVHAGQVEHRVEQDILQDRTES